MGLQICLGTHIQNIRCCLQCFTAWPACYSLLHCLGCWLQSASLRGALAAVCFTAWHVCCSLLHCLACLLQSASLPWVLAAVCFTACCACCSLFHCLACLLQPALLSGPLAAVCFTAGTMHIYMLLASTFLWMDMLRCLVIRPVCGATLLWMANQLPPHAGWGRPYTPHKVSAVNVQL